MADIAFYMLVSILLLICFLGLLVMIAIIIINALPLFTGDYRDLPDRQDYGLQPSYLA
jgi:hypothetical protein